MNNQETRKIDELQAISHHFFENNTVYENNNFLTRKEFFILNFISFLFFFIIVGDAFQSFSIAGKSLILSYCLSLFSWSILTAAFYYFFRLPTYKFERTKMEALKQQHPNLVAYYTINLTNHSIMTKQLETIISSLIQDIKDNPDELAYALKALKNTPEAYNEYVAHRLVEISKHVAEQRQAARQKQQTIDNALRYLENDENVGETNSSKENISIQEEGK